jgi:hypothetical protein
MAKAVKLTKMASDDYLHPTVSGSEGSIHINLEKEVITGSKDGQAIIARPLSAESSLMHVMGQVNAPAKKGLPERTRRILAA